MKRIKQITIAIALLLAVQVGAQNVGDDAPDFTLNQLDGGSFNLADQMGKVVFIFTFGNSCSHCIANGPNTETGIYSNYKNNSNFVAVGIDAWNGSSGQVQSYRASTGLTYPLLLDGGTMVSNYSTTYDRMIVIDQDGVIRYKGTSNASTSKVAEASTIISGLLATAPLDEEVATSVSFEAAYVSSQNALRVNNPFGTSAQVMYRVMDLSGRILQQSSLSLSESNIIALDATSKGLNFINISDGQRSYTAKFIR